MLETSAYIFILILKMGRWAAPCESQTASSPRCNGNGHGDSGEQQTTATATATATVTQRQRNCSVHQRPHGKRQRPRSRQRHGPHTFERTRTNLSTHTHKNTHSFETHTHTHLGTHTHTFETATWRRNIHFGVHRSALHVRSIHFFSGPVKIEKQSSELFPDRSKPNNLVPDFFRAGQNAVRSSGLVSGLVFICAPTCCSVGESSGRAGSSCAVLFTREWMRTETM